MVYACYMLLILLGFLISLNGFLHGLKKRQIDVGLFVATLVVIGFMFFSFGGTIALLGLGIAFITPGAVRPFAANVASRLLGGSNKSTGDYIGLPDKTLEAISQKLGQTISDDDFMDDLLTDRSGKVQAIDDLYEYCQTQEATRELLNSNHISRSKFNEMYDSLILHGGAGQWVVGHWLAASLRVNIEPNSSHSFLSVTFRASVGDP